ncbi:MAG: SurA N-terminal domain-containing protein [Proteobacteria bacterium]|nr:SurA N-terminal domain-containing protein [Pseudomonadota bacterium]
MKYILLIFSLFVVISGAVVYIIGFSDDQVEKETVAIKINDRVICKDELMQRYSFRSSHLQDHNEFIQSLISRELFIQEAKKQKIDQEDKFRQAIQNFYEQSLIRILMDRKMDSLNIEVSESVVERYVQLLDKSIDFTLWTLESPKIEEREIDISLLGKGTTRQNDFRDLSIELRNILAQLNEGELSAPTLIKTELFASQYLIVRLNLVKPSGKELNPGSMNKDKIKTILRDVEKQNALNDWAENLKNSADISLMIDANESPF